MADVTAHFTVYKGSNNSHLKHVATVLKQSNFRDALQLVKQKPFNGNIFVNPREKKSIIEFLVPHQPLNIFDLTTMVVLFFTSNFILTNEELNELKSIVNYFKENNSSKHSWENKWATLEDELFYREIQPFLQITESRLQKRSLKNNFDNESPIIVIGQFQSPVTNQDFSVISYDTNLLNQDENI